MKHGSDQGVPTLSSYYNIYVDEDDARNHDLNARDEFLTYNFLKTKYKEIYDSWRRDDYAVPSSVVDVFEVRLVLVSDF